MFDIVSYFTDPILRAPTIGCIAMAVSSALVGTLLVLQKRSLMGEALSHAAFPGVVLGVSIAAPFWPQESEGFGAILLLCAFLFSLLGIKMIDMLQKHCKVSSDAALCFILALFFGIGVLIASRLQVIQTAWYRQALIFLYGQAATMMDRYLPIYCLLTLFTVVILTVAYPQIQILLFDGGFAKRSKIKTRSIEVLLTLLVALAVVIGMRSMGAVLMAGMLIAPAVAARPWCSHLHSCLWLSSVFALISALTGNILSVEGTRWLLKWYPDWVFSLPTGPLILLVAAGSCFFSLLFAPKGGVISRLFKRFSYRQKILTENLLKAFWKQGREAAIEVKELQGMIPFCDWLLFRMRCLGWVRRKTGGRYSLSAEGWARACRIVRLHRLWEVYLVEYMSQGIDRVHRSAEELEHVMDEALEQELERLLGDLTADPHRQPIPTRQEGGR
ncbi:MAG: metal ABC transporter permease [Simkania sp.]|nr:metal ABC transporter permease [Simkania sp.]